MLKLEYMGKDVFTSFSEIGDSADMLPLSESAYPTTGGVGGVEPVMYTRGSSTSPEARAIAIASPST